jgi:hypothetical protein
LKKRIGVLMYQTSTSKGQELLAQRMVRDFISLGHEAYLITSVYHDGVEVIPSKSINKRRGYAFVDDEGLGIPGKSARGHENRTAGLDGHHFSLLLRRSFFFTARPRC